MLRPTHSQRRLAHRLPPIPPAPNFANLSADEKEDLFRNFDEYLSRSEKLR